jgi:hypothetical protein
MTAYCEFDDIEESMPDTSWSGDYITVLEALSERASLLIDRATGREPSAFYASDTATARIFDGGGCGSQWVDEMAAAPTLVEVDESGIYSYATWTTSDYAVWPYNATPYTRLDILRTGDHAAWPCYTRSVRVTARWGYSLTPPEDIKQATIIQTIRWFKRAQQAYQDAGAIVELGQLRYVRQLDPDVEFIVEHYRRLAI